MGGELKFTGQGTLDVASAAPGSAARTAGPRLEEDGDVKPSVREALNGILGSAVPGLLYLVAAAALLLAVARSVAITYAAWTGIDPWPSREGWTAFLPTGPSWIGVGVVLIALSYAVGHIFHRHDPLAPDVASWRRTWRRSLRRPFHPVSGGWVPCGSLPRGHLLHRWWKDRFPLYRLPTDAFKNWVARDENECAFPYTNLKAYLSSRGLAHLAEMVPWTPENPGTRTKGYINALKIRLEYHFPSRTGALVRNEAHVRLSTSTWYLCQALRSHAIGAFALIVIAAMLHPSVTSWFGTGHGSSAKPTRVDALLAHALGALVAIAVGLAQWRIRVNHEEFLHYQRVREIVFVLETAYTAFRSDPGWITDLCPGFAPTPTAAPQSSVPAGGAAAQTPRARSGGDDTGDPVASADESSHSAQPERG